MTSGGTGVIRKPSRPRSSPPSRLVLQIAAHSGRSHVPFLRGKLKLAHPLMNAPELQEVSLALVNDQAMSDLHERFMGLPGPTDVLTFPLETDSRGRTTAGEIVVCVPEATRRAREHKSVLRNELLLYCIHGMLHLVGFDDKSEREFRRMHRVEDMILTTLGIGPVFARPASSQSVPSGRRRTVTRPATSKGHAIGAR